MKYHIFAILSIPEQLEAVSCKTHEQILVFLKKISNSEVKNKFIFCHKNNLRYDAHIDADPDTFAASLFT